jgi:hypothetical protein
VYWCKCDRATGTGDVQHAALDGVTVCNGVNVPGPLDLVMFNMGLWMYTVDVSAYPSTSELYAQMLESIELRVASGGEWVVFFSHGCLSLLPLLPLSSGDKLRPAPACRMRSSGFEVVAWLPQMSLRFEALVPECVADAGAAPRLVFKSVSAAKPNESPGLYNSAALARVNDMALEAVATRAQRWEVKGLGFRRQLPLAHSIRR